MWNHPYNTVNFSVAWNFKIWALLIASVEIFTQMSENLQVKNNSKKSFFFRKKLNLLFLIQVTKNGELFCGMKF